VSEGKITGGRRGEPTDMDGWRNDKCKAIGRPVVMDVVEEHGCVCVTDCGALMTKVAGLL
jgi:hypothetical protein